MPLKAITLTDSAMNLHCPYEALWSYTAIRPKYNSLNEAFFVFRDRSPVMPQQLRGVLKKILMIESFDKKLYLVHGLCAGRAIDLMEMGVSVESIKKIGCWKSNAVFPVSHLT